MLCHRCLGLGVMPQIGSPCDSCDGTGRSGCCDGDTCAQPPALRVEGLEPNLVLVVNGDRLCSVERLEPRQARGA